MTMQTSEVYAIFFTNSGEGDFEGSGNRLSMYTQVPVDNKYKGRQKTNAAFQYCTVTQKAR
jgi:hypothetical protein